MKFRADNIVNLSIEELKELISKWIEFKLKERDLKFTLNGAYELINNDQEIKLKILNDVKLNEGQSTFLAAYKRVIDEGLVPFEQMADELNGIKY